MERFKIFGDLDSGNCLKVKFTADKLGLAYEWVPIDIRKRETRGEAFLKINPFGQIPVIQLADGRTLAQSNAIVKFLARDSALVSQDPFVSAKIDEWMFWEQYSHEPALAVLRFKVFYQGLSTEDIDPQLIQETHQALRIMDVHLDQAPFLVDRRFTIADIALVAYTRLAHEARIDLTSYPAVRSWVGRCERELKLAAL